MSLFFKRDFGPTADQMIPDRGYGGGAARVTAGSAMQHSAVWACIRLRADLVSSMPVDFFRRTADGQQVETVKPEVLMRPGALFVGGTRSTVDEWLYATQQDLDRCGNTFGLIVDRDGAGRPARIDLVPYRSVTVKVRSGALSYTIDGKPYSPLEVWHERQFVVSGLPVGLSPVAHAAMTIGQYLNAQQFAQAWFSGGATPGGHLKNTKKTLTGRQSQKVKRIFKESVSNGDVFVSGADWELKMFGSDASTSQFLETERFSIADTCRFFGVPGDLIGAETSTGSVTYANITQRNLQLLIMNLGPAVQRRETAMTTLSAAPRFVKLNSDALLRMDPLTRAQMLAGQITSRQRTVSEARGYDNLPPLTPEQVEEFNVLFANRQEPQKAGTTP